MLRHCFTAITSLSSSCGSWLQID